MNLCTSEYELIPVQGDHFPNSVTLLSPRGGGLLNVSRQEASRQVSNVRIMLLRFVLGIAVVRKSVNASFPSIVLNSTGKEKNIAKFADAKSLNIPEILVSLGSDCSYKILTRLQYFQPGQN